MNRMTQVSESAQSEPRFVAQRAFGKFLTHLQNLDKIHVFVPIFFKAGNRFFFQCSMACSSRSFAFSSGFCRLNPKLLTICRVQTSLHRKPVTRFRTRVNRGSVHRFVSYPYACGPFTIASRNNSCFLAVSCD